MESCLVPGPVCSWLAKNNRHIILLCTLQILSSNLPMCFIGCKTLRARDVIERFLKIELMTAMRFKVMCALWGAHGEHLTRNYFIIKIRLLQHVFPEYSLCGIVKRATGSFQGNKTLHCSLPVGTQSLFSLDAVSVVFFPSDPHLIL